MAGITAAALTSENKGLAHPASVDSIPTSANQEDHVSMATHGARRLHDMLDNLEHIVAVELLAAAQGVEFHRPARSSEALEEALGAVRRISPPYTRDRALSAGYQGRRRAYRERRFPEIRRYGPLLTNRRGLPATAQFRFGFLKSRTH